MTNSDLLAAHIELGRLVQALEDAPELAGLFVHEALRREAWASLQLDGQLVDLDDIAAGQMDVGLLAGQRILGVEPALALNRAAEAMLRGLRSDDRQQPVQEEDGDEEARVDLDLLPPEVEDEEDEPLGREPFVPSFMDTKALLADIDDFLERAVPPKREAPVTASVVLEPLSEAWLMKAWTMAWGEPSEADAAALARAADAIGDALESKPGLSGVALALHRLHAQDFWPEAPAPGVPGDIRDWEPDAAAQLDVMLAERQEVGPGWRFARLISPWLIGRACGLADPGPWISEAMLAGRYGYSSAATSNPAAFETWLARMLADGLPTQRRRLAELRTRLEMWRRRLGKDRRPKRGGPLAALPLLVERPVMLPGWLATRQGVTMRAAQMTLASLATAGVVRETSGRYCYKVWSAV